jgi:hypothetical protein
MRTLTSSIAALLLAIAANAPAADLAVLPAPGGDDSGNGSGERPFATIARALARAGSGDTIHLARGAVYRESGLEFRAGLALKADGPADKAPPLITASVKIDGLKPWTKNAKVLTAKVAGPILDCYADGRWLTPARYPNSGWMRAATGSTPAAILDPERAKAPGAAAGRWKGAQAHWRRWSWWWETRPIVDDDGAGRLALGPDNRFQDDFTGVGSAFYVDGCLAELDAPGEWCWDAGALYVYPPADAEATALIEAVPAAAKECAVSGATLDGVGFARFGPLALRIGGRSVVANCLFQDIGDTAIRSDWNGAGSQVRGCAFRDVRNVGISWNEDPKDAGGTVIERCEFERIGMAFGQGGSGAWHASGIVLYNGKPVTVRLNRMMDVGYCGVILGFEGNVIERNVLVRCMGSLNDGAAIYANTNASVIRENIVLDTVGNLETSHPWYPLGHGIWLEFLKDFHDAKVVGNTVFGSGGNGLFLTNNFHCEVRENVFAGNRISALHLSGDKGRAQGHVIADNVLAALSPARRIRLVEPVASGWGGDFVRCIDFEDGFDYGTMTGTTLIAPPATPLVACRQQRWNDAAWAKDRTWADAGARIVRAQSLLLINDTVEPFEFAVPGGGWSDLAGRPATKVAVPPFRSVVVVRPDESTQPPYLTASGADYRAASLHGDAKAVDVAAKKPREAAVARPALSAKPRPEAWKRYVDQLRARTATLAGGRSPAKFRYSALNGVVTVTAVTGDSATLKLGDDAGGGEISARLFAAIKVDDARALALDAQRKDDPGQHALAAFFARCAGDNLGYQQHLERCADLAAEVEGSFEP